jgi:long-chain acyl-CoA synthetase
MLMKSLPYDPGVPQTIEIPNAPLTSLLIDAVAKYPDNTAISFFGTSITYRQFDALVKKAMNVLRGLGVNKGDMVAIMSPNCPQAVIAYQAILRIGAVVTQVNPLYVEREIEAQLNDAGAKLAIVLNLFAPKIANIIANTRLEKVAVFRLEEFMPWPVSWLFPIKLLFEGRSVRTPKGAAFYDWRRLMDEAQDTAEPASVDAGDVALIQYTGGTTGVAKGVILTHRNVLANAMQCRAWFTDTQEGKEVFLLALPVFHAFGMTAGMNLALSLSAAIVLVPKFDADTVMKLIEKNRVTMFPGVPAMYVAIINHPKAAKRDISSIKYCLSGAAALPTEVKRRFEELTGGKLVEGYGLTEASPVTHGNPLSSGGKPASIGLPLPGTLCIIARNEDAEECAPGELGEVMVSGPQVMAGYHNKPEETAKVLKNGWLFTGDLGYMDDDSYVFLMDRKKEMIISGGCNVYPKEVEDVLFSCPGVKEAAAVGMEDSYLGEKVVAAVVLQDGARVTEKDIQDHCRKSLASFKVPKKIYFRDNLPKTVIGKVLKRVLKEELGKVG